MAWFETWVKKLETHNERHYEPIQIKTSLGKTHIWGLNTSIDKLETLVIFPGARTSALFWDFDRGLDHMGKKFRIFLIETNGLPNLSEGNTPDIKTNAYGEWALEVLQALKLTQVHIAGASFGGLICMKLCLIAPHIIKTAFLLNPGCLQPFSLHPKNLYYNLLPIVNPSRKNVIKFLEQAVFCKPQHTLSETAETLLVEYEVFALKRYMDKTQKPYYMGSELEQIRVNTYLLEGSRDILFPPALSIKNAHAKICTLKQVFLFENVGHGIETYPKAIHTIGQTILSQ